MFLLKFFKFPFHFLICIFYDFVLKVTAIDKDISAPNNVVIYNKSVVQLDNKFSLPSFQCPGNMQVPVNYNIYKQYEINFYPRTS